jgi:hypothetical protein
MVETSKQVSVFLDNKPGRLTQVLAALAHQKVNVTALTIMDSYEHSVLRLVTDDVSTTIEVLDDLNISHSETEVLVVELRNQPGELAHVCEQLSSEHIQISYLYSSSGGRNGKVMGIFKVSSPDKAKALLNGSAPAGKKERRSRRDRRAYSPPATAR